jgi:hypothetical protein
MKNQKAMPGRAREPSICVRMLAAFTFALALSGCGGGSERDDDVYFARSIEIHVASPGSWRMDRMLILTPSKVTSSQF